MRTTRNWIYIGIAIGFFIVWMAAPLIVKILAACLYRFDIQTSSLESLGQFGDIFGSINALFSGFAFIGILYTMNLQRIDLANQHEQFIKERFESNLFQLITYHNEIVKTMNLSKNARRWEGRDCFQILFEDMMDEFNKVIGKIPSVEEVYGSLYDHRQISVGHYFRNLYHIFNYIDIQTEINDDQRLFYAKIVRAQLSLNELRMLYYNGLSKYGVKKFKPLIEKYHVLKSLKKEHLHDDMNNMDLYAKNAFEEEKESPTKKT